MAKALGGFRVARRTRQTALCAARRGSPTEAAGTYVDPENLLTRIADDGGSVLVETALVLPFYFLIIFGLISFAMIFFSYCSATYAAKAAVRYAAVHSAATLSPCTSSTIQAMVTANLWATPTGGATITSQWNPSNSIGSVVSVTIKLNYGANMPFVNLTNFVGTASSQGYVVF